MTNDVEIIGIDLAKNTFQLHGLDKEGGTVFRRKMNRSRLLEFVSTFEPCLIAMEACGGAHHWAREFQSLGHQVRLIHPIYVKPFVKRQKNDAADAEAIAEAASRPSMRFVPIKSAERQAQSMLLKTRDLLNSQRTQTINALRGHMTEQGIVVPKGPANVRRIEEVLSKWAEKLPEQTIKLSRLLIEKIYEITEEISSLTKEIKRLAENDEVTKRLMTIPGIGPICAVTIAVLAPDPESFRRGRDFSAWAGLTPRQFSTGGKARLGRISKMGQKDLRRLLVLGATSLIKYVDRDQSSLRNSWFISLLERKPRKVAAVAMANKMARMAWAIMRFKEIYRDPVAA